MYVVADYKVALRQAVCSLAKLNSLISVFGIDYFLVNAGFAGIVSVGVVTVVVDSGYLWDLSGFGCCFVMME